MRGGLGPGDDPVDPDVGRQVAVGQLEQFEREVELGLCDLLAEMEVGPVGHPALLRA